MDSISDVWFGFHQSVKPAQGRVLLNMDLAAGLVRKDQPVLNMVCSTLRIRSANQLDRLQNLNDLTMLTKVSFGANYIKRIDPMPSLKNLTHVKYMKKEHSNT